ncbi:hypothetical protein BDZ91DRAFT_720985, partial [Kalaharituber pfeilii]
TFSLRRDFFHKVLIFIKVLNGSLTTNEYSKTHQSYRQRQRIENLCGTLCIRYADTSQLFSDCHSGRVP